MGAVIVIMMKENSDPLSIVLVKNFKNFRVLRMTVSVI